MPARPGFQPLLDHPGGIGGSQAGSHGVPAVGDHLERRFFASGQFFLKIFRNGQDHHHIFLINGFLDLGRILEIRHPLEETGAVQGGQKRGGSF